MNKCSICNEPTENNQFCEIHQAAYNKLHEEYNKWKKAVEITWEDYLDELIKNQYTGKAIKEIIDYLKNHSD